MRSATFITELETGFGHVLEWQLPDEKVERHCWSRERFYVLVLAQGVCKDLVKGLSEQENLIPTSFEFFNEDATFDLLGGLPGVGHEEYLALPFPLVLNVLGMVSTLTNGYENPAAYLIESGILPLSGLETDQV